MAVITDNQTVSSNVSGFKKRIDESAATMMLDNLQTFMYQKPIQSCVRESVSNAIDAVKEKRMAMSILNGSAKVSDYYVEKEIDANQADIYRDSKFNKDYYELKWLDNKDQIKLTYHNTDATQRDTFTITDTGVGLGGRRLEGFFNLGYSSKRLNTKELGGFGLGAKSPLATGVDCYRLLTRYNGMEFCFDIYSHKVDCVYGKWNEDGSTNPHYEFEPHIVGYEQEMDFDGTYKDDTTKPIYSSFKAYYKPTTEKNSTSIIVEVKTHNKHQYFEAVKSQLMYIKEDVIFQETYSHTSQINTIQFKAKIIYEDDHLILSDYNYYNRPHYVIKNIAYGIIDWAELELTPKLGNVGYKMQMEKIDVLPSREAVVYSLKTRAATVEENEYVNAIVEKKITETLNQSTFVEWIRACNRIMFSSSNSGDIISRLSMLSEKSAISPSWKDTDLKFNTDLKQFMSPLLRIEYAYIKEDWNRRAGGYTKKLTRTEADNIGTFAKPIYFQFTPGSNRVSQYLMTLHRDGFCSLRPATNYSYLDAIFRKIQLGTATDDEAKEEITTLIKENEADQAKITALLGYIPKTILFIKTLASDKSVLEYGPDLVPATFVAKESEDEVDFEAIDEAARKNAYKAVLARRRANQEFIINKVGIKLSGSYYSAGFIQTEVKYNDLDADSCQLVYGTGDQDNIFLLLSHLARYTGEGKQRVPNQPTTFYWNDDLKLFKVAKSNIRHVKEDGMELKNWIYSISEEGVLTTCEPFHKIFTATALDSVLTQKARFLTNFGEFDISLSSKYTKLRNFTLDNDKVGKLSEPSYTHPLCDALIDAYNINLKLLKAPNATEEEREVIIGKKLWDEGIRDIQLIDAEKYQEANWMMDFVDVYGSLLSYIEPLTNARQPVLPTELVGEVKQFIEAKVDQLEGEYPDLIL